MGRGMRWTRRGLALAALTVTMPAAPAVAQTPTPTLEDPDLAVRPAATGLNQPVSMAFIDKDEFLRVAEERFDALEHKRARAASTSPHTL